MANIQGTYRGVVISIKNDQAAAILPYRVVAPKAQGTCKYPTATGKDFLGVSLPNLLYDDNSNPDGLAMGVQIDGVADIDCFGVVGVNDYVKVYGAAGQVSSAGAFDTLSGGASAEVPLVGIALEAGSTSRIAVLIRPQIA